jgi:hypothetical protein
MKKINFFIFLFFLISSAVSYSQKMNSETEDLVIEKMERVILMMEASDPSWIPSQQRLADLLSERARGRFMLEIEANCKGCRGSQIDREKAVKIYEKLLKTVSLKEDGRIFFQLAHLYQMAGNNEKAQNLFENLLKNGKKKKVSPSVISRSQAGLADILFQKGKFKAALKNYSLALKDQSLGNKALLIYNKAWCEFNLDQIKTASRTLLVLLTHPEQITRDNDEGKVYDPSFHYDMIKDLATFYSKLKVTQVQINGFEKLLPKEQSGPLLLHFANEVDRVGQKNAARIILERYLKVPNLTQEQRLQAILNKAQVNYDNGQSAQSTQDFAKAAEVYQHKGCDQAEDCLKIQKAMKHYVTELHRSKKTKPDLDLLNSYSVYAKTFPLDIEMAKRGAQVALDINQFSTAVQLYRLISSNADNKLKDKEEALLNEITASEKSKNTITRIDSYNYYLEHSSNLTKKYEVRYQLAYLAFQHKKFKQASEAFYILVNDQNGSIDLRKKSADLSLDCLVRLNDEERLEARAWEYSKTLPKFSQEFETLARKSLMNQVAHVANNNKSSPGDLRKYLDKTKEVNLSRARLDEKVLFYSNTAVLSQMLDDQDSYLKSQQNLLNLRGLPKIKKQEVYKELAAFFEKRLDFKQAYYWTLKINNPKISRKEKEFRLGTLADLGNQKPEKHYRLALKAGLNDSRTTNVRIRLVELSQNPIAELKKQAHELKRHPQLLNDLVLLVYAKTGQKKFLESLINSKELRNRSASYFILSQSLFRRINQLKRKLSASRIRSYKTQALQKATVERVKLLNQADRLLKESLSLKDITAQMMLLELISIENDRLVHELAALPKPKGLTTNQENQYKTVLKGKLHPFLYKAKLADQQKQKIWNKSFQLSQLINDYKQTRPELQKLMIHKLDILNQISGNGPLKDSIKETLSSNSPSIKELAMARQVVSKKPEDIREIEKLKILETKMGHPLMPAYLEARLNNLQKGKSL